MMISDAKNAQRNNYKPNGKLNPCINSKSIRFSHTLYYTQNNFLGYSMDSAFRTMILFIGIGDKVKQKYGCQNFY